jgi:hypothetical protein
MRSPMVTLFSLSVFSMSPERRFGKSMDCIGWRRTFVVSSSTRCRGRLTGGPAMSDYRIEHHDHVASLPSYGGLQLGIHLH